MKLIVMTADQAATIRAMDNGPYGIDPRPMADGRCVVSPDLVTDDRYAQYRDILGTLPISDINPTWPAQDDD